MNRKRPLPALPGIGFLLEMNLEFHGVEPVIGTEH